MKQGFFTIQSQEKIAKDVFRMVLAGDTSAITATGQFVNLLLDGKYLHRPISVCDWAPGELTLIYKVVGAGTQQMSRMQAGEKLDVLSGLGNGYNTAKSGDRPLLIGGGVGVPPLYALCKQLIAEGKINTEPLLTHTYPLAKIDEAYELFENKRDGVIKVAVEC